MNIFARLFRRGNLEKQPPPFLRISDTPPAPIINPAWQQVQQTREPFDIQRAANRVVYDAWPWPQERPALTLAKTVPLAVVREGRDTGRAIAAAQHASRILVVDDLPLMANPFAPEYRPWHSNAVTAIYDAYEALPSDAKRWLRRLCIMTPERVGMHIAIWYPARAEMWRGATAAQVLPILAGLAVNTLRPLCKLPYECITDIDPHMMPFVASMGDPCWRLEIYEADAPDELEMAG